ncbi:MAG: response regulator [Elainellaceae cyanobacterium]
MKLHPIRILLVEDDELFRLGLVTRLQQEAGLEVVAEAEDGETAIEFAQQYTPDVVVLDVGLPGMSGVEACRQIKQKQPNLPVLILTSHSQKPLINRLVEAKAQGYCLKGIAAEFLILAIRSVVAGASWWDSTATREIHSVFQSSQVELPVDEVPALDNPLTKREQEILALVATGKSNQEIANILYIAPGTVRVHVHTILQKLEVRDRTQAAVLAIQRELVDPSLLKMHEAD